MPRQSPNNPGVIPPGTQQETQHEGTGAPQICLSCVFSPHKKNGPENHCEFFCFYKIIVRICWPLLDHCWIRVGFFVGLLLGSCWVSCWVIAGLVPGLLPDLEPSVEPSGDPLLDPKGLVKPMKYPDGLNVAIQSDELQNWLNTKAY